MFGLIKRSTHEAVVEGLTSDVRQAEAAADKLTMDLRDLRTVYAQQMRYAAEDARQIRVLTEALNAITAERDALRDAAAAKRAKQLANLRNQPKLEQATH